MRNIIFLTFSFFTLNSILSASQGSQSPVRSNDPYRLECNSAYIYRMIQDLESKVNHAASMATQTIVQSQDDRRNMAMIHQRVDESYNFIRFYMDQTIFPFLDSLPKNLLRQAQKKIDEQSINHKEDFALLLKQFEMYGEKTTILLQQQAEDQKKIQILQRQLKEGEKRNEEQDKKNAQLQKMHSQLMERVLKLEQKEQEKNQMFQRTLKKLDSYSEKIQEEMTLRKDLIQKISISDKLKKDVEKIEADLKKLQSKIESKKDIDETILRIEKHVNNLEVLYEKKHPLQQSTVDASTSTDAQETPPSSEVTVLGFLSPLKEKIPKIKEAEKEQNPIIEKISETSSQNFLIIPENSKAQDHEKQEIFGIIQKVVNEFLPGELTKLEVVDFTKDTSENYLLQNAMAESVVAKMINEGAISEKDYIEFKISLKKKFIEYATEFMMKEDIDHKKHLEVIEYMCKLDSYANQFCFMTSCMDFCIKNNAPIKDNILSVLKKILYAKIHFIHKRSHGEEKKRCIISQIIMINENIPLITSFIKKIDNIQDVSFFVDYYKQLLDSYVSIKNIVGIPNFPVGVDVAYQRSQLKYFILKYIQETGELRYCIQKYTQEEDEHNKKKIGVLQKTFDLLNDIHCKECIHTIIPQNRALSDTDNLCLKVVLTSLNIVYVKMPENFFECMLSIFKSLNTTHENLVTFYNIIADMHKQKKQFKGFKKEIMAFINSRAIPDPDLK